MKNKANIQVSFDGQSSEHVTGSMIHVQSKDIDILLDCGTSQSNNLRRDFYENSERFPFKVKAVQAVFCPHVHLDHIGRLPFLVKKGFNGIIYIPKGNISFMRNMLLDCAFINARDAQFMSKILEKNIEPLYNENDVENTISKVIEIDFNNLYYVNDYLQFKFIGSGHIVNAAQLILYITVNNVMKKILYTSDLGNIQINNKYSTKFEPCEKANLVIGESTYGSRKRKKADKKERELDRNKIKSIVTEVCLHNKGKVLIPVFALDRLQNIMTELYDLFHNDPNFNIPIIIDTPLGLRNNSIYLENNINNFEEVYSWDHFIKVGEHRESEIWARSPQPMIILASSGMMTQGRVLTHLPYILSNSKNHIISVGYSAEGTIGNIIKEGKQKTITVNGKNYPNKCGFTSLNSFSSHMQRNDLINYYSSINCEKIALQHGQINAKLELAEDLKEKISKLNKTTKVIVVNRGVKINL